MNSELLLAISSWRTLTSKLSLMCGSYCWQQNTCLPPWVCVAIACCVQHEMLEPLNFRHRNPHASDHILTDQGGSGGSLVPICRHRFCRLALAAASFWLRCCRPFASPKFC